MSNDNIYLDEIKYDAHKEGLDPRVFAPKQTQRNSHTHWWTENLEIMPQERLPQNFLNIRPLGLSMANFVNSN